MKDFVWNRKEKLIRISFTIMFAWRSLWASAGFVTHSSKIIKPLESVWKLIFSFFILLLIFVGYKVISFVKNKFNTVLKMNHILMILICIWKTQNLFPILMPEFNYESWINSKLHISDSFMAIHYMYIAEMW